VAEEVQFGFTPGVTWTVNWTASQGGLSDDPSWQDAAGEVLYNSTKFTAPSNAANATVTATIMGTGDTLKVPFQVFEPAGLDHATITKTFTNWYSIGTVAARMHLNVYVKPANVSFYQIECMEIGEDATNITGGFTEVPNPPSYFTHKGGPGLGLGDEWFSIGADNSWQHSGDEGWDTCFLVWPGSCPGGFTWPIPAEWRIGNDTTTEHANLHFSDQVFSVDANGTMTIQKFNTNVVRTIYNVTTPSL
jgi:hypothetical protein